MVAAAARPTGFAPASSCSLPSLPLPSSGLVDYHHEEEQAYLAGQERKQTSEAAAAAPSC